MTVALVKSATANEVRADNTILSPGHSLARDIAALTADRVPDDVLALTQLFVLDTLGVMIAGRLAPGIRELARAIQDMEPDGKATVLVNGFSSSPSAAALINGAAAHALDYDDTHDVARIHAFSVVLPAALAAAEMEENISGKDFLSALAVGAEIFCRLGLTCYNSLAKGWHPTTAFGCLAAACTAGKIFKLDAGQMTHALGLSFVQLSGTTQSITDGALSKRLGPGFAARNGLLAAHLARAGLTGPWRFLEGDAGLFMLYERGEVRPDLLLDGLGSQWRLRELSMKPFPCCRCTHSLIQIGLDLHHDGLNPAEIENGTLYLGHTNHAIVGAPFEISHDNPVVHAQFNACYAFSRSLIDGRVDISTFTKERVQSQPSTLAERLTCEASSQIVDALAPAHIRLNLKNGDVITRSRVAMKGSPEEPMCEEEILEKFTTNLEWGAGIRRLEARDLAQLVRSAHSMRNIRALPEAFAAAMRDAAKPL